MRHWNGIDLNANYVVALLDRSGNEVSYSGYQRQRAAFVNGISIDEVVFPVVHLAYEKSLTIKSIRLDRSIGLFKRLGERFLFVDYQDQIVKKLRSDLNLEHGDIAMVWNIALPNCDYPSTSIPVNGKILPRKNSK